MKISYKSHLMHSSFRPDICPFWISTPPRQWLQLIALKSSMDLWFRKDGQWQGGGGRGNRFALMSEISRENIIKIYFKTWIFSYQNCNMNREEVSILHSYKHVMVENQKPCSMWIQRNRYFKSLGSLVEICRNRDRSKRGYLINVWLNTLVKFSDPVFLPVK